MIDTDKCEHILYDTVFNPIDVYNVAEELLAEVKRLREEKRFVELEHGIGLDNREAQVTIRLNQHYEKQHEKLLAEVKQLQDALKEAVEVVKEMESMAYADADADKFANHALEFIGNVKELIE